MAPNSPGRQSVPLVGEVNVLLPRVLVCVWGGAVGCAGEEVGRRWEVGAASFHPQLALAARAQSAAPPLPLPGAV